MRFIDFIRDRARYYNCPVCGRSLRDCELRMLRHVDDRYTVQVTCAACQVQFIVILAIQGEGLEPLTQDELALDVELAEHLWRMMVKDEYRRARQHDQTTGPGGHSGATLQSSADGPIPTAASSDKSQPGPATRKRRTLLAATS